MKDTAGNEVKQLLSHCKLCGKKLELTNEIDICTKCQNTQELTTHIQGR